MTLTFGSLFAGINMVAENKFAAKISEPTGCYQHRLPALTTHANKEHGMAEKQPTHAHAAPQPKRQISEEHRRRMSEAAKARCSPEWRQSLSEKLRLPLDDHRLRELYESGKTQNECAVELGVTQKRICKAMKRLGIKARPAVKRNQTGSANASWKGIAVKYQGQHVRVEAARGKPLKCERCGLDDPSARYDWANLTGNYLDVNDFQRMCRRCHKNYDNEKRGGRDSAYRWDVTREAVVELRNQGYSINEIAKRLGTSWPTVKDRLSST